MVLSHHKNFLGKPIFQVFSKREKNKNTAAALDISGRVLWASPTERAISSFPIGNIMLIFLKNFGII
jgi:hypothetical protein